MNDLNQYSLDEFLNSEIRCGSDNCQTTRITLFQMNDNELERDGERQQNNTEDASYNNLNEFSLNKNSNLQLVHLDKDNIEENRNIIVNDAKSDQYFKINLPTQAKFQLNSDDWNILKSFQNGHRFQKGEWEDYFIAGMKQSNKYCVFAFKDHYVNQTSIRKRKTNMESGVAALRTKELLDSDPNSNTQKVFSAQGYCVFEDCSIKFYLKMNAEQIVHVFYTGELKHSLNQINARYFRGKSRQELKEILKHTKPKREYLQRIESKAKDNLEYGNADYVGKTPSVYRRIAAEAKDCYQALLCLQNELIDKDINSNFRSVKGYIQIIQHFPGSIVCFDHNQIDLYKKWFSNQLLPSHHFETITPCLHISCYQRKSLVRTTINGKNLQFYEMCLQKNQLVNSQNFDPQLIPLSFMLTTNSLNKTGLLQWLHSFFDSVENKSITYPNEKTQNKLNVICDISMPLIETLISIFRNQSFAKYSINCFKKCIEKLSNNNEEFIISDINMVSIHSELEADFSVYVDDNASLDGDKLNDLVIHTCTNQFMNEISSLCNYYYPKNYSFGMYAFSCLVNSQSLFELEKCLHSIMCILYSKKLNKLVEKSFDFLKSRLTFYGAQNQINKNNKIAKNPKHKPKNSKTVKENSNEFYVFDNQIIKQNDNRFEENEENFGLKAFKRLTCEPSTFLVRLQDEKLDKLNQNSIFFMLCEKLLAKTKSLVDHCEKEEMDKNPREGRELLFYFLKQFSATLPLWMNKSILFETSLPTTLKLHTDRFDKLTENMTFNNEQNYTVETFIKKIYDENSSQVKSYLELYSKDQNKSVKQKIFECSLNSLISNDNDIEIIDDNLSDKNKNSSSEYSNGSSIKLSNKNDIIRVKNGILKEKSQRDNVQKLCKNVRKIVNRKSNQAQTEFETDFLLKVNKPLIQTSIFNNSNTNVESNENNCVTSIVVLSNESNELEQEIVIKRQRQIITNAFGLELTKDDIDSLENLSLPNSNIIEFYLKQLETNKNDASINKKEVYIFPVRFYPTLKYGQNNQISMNNNQFNFNENQNFTIFDYSLVLIPIHKTSTDHWALAGIDFKKEHIKYYDSSLTDDFDCLKYLRDYLELEYFKKFNLKYDFNKWKFSNEKNISKETNEKDCALFVLLYAKCLINNQELIFEKNEIENFRNQLKNEIYYHISK